MNTYVLCILLLLLLLLPRYLCAYTLYRHTKMYVSILFYDYSLYGQNRQYALYFVIDVPTYNITIYTHNIGNTYAWTMDIPMRIKRSRVLIHVIYILELLFIFFPSNISRIDSVRTHVIGGYYYRRRPVNLLRIIHNIAELLVYTPLVHTTVRETHKLH